MPKAQANEQAKTKKKKSKLKRLIIALIVLALIAGILYGAFQYFGSVVRENLTSIAESEEFVKKGNEKVKIGTYFESIDTLLTESVALSAYAYDADDKSADYQSEFKKLGYSEIRHYNNKPSQLYKRLSKKDKTASTLLSPVNATVAIKKSGEEYVVAVAFKGTDSSNISDDLSDIYKAVDKNGFHKGFMFNAEEFAKKADSISFTVDGEKITLEQILNNMKTDGSKYKMLVTGHSLGAAVADIYVGYILKNEGIITSNVVAITYGTPKSCSNDYEYTADNILNIINTDDLVPTIGAENHIGTCLYYTPSESFRKSNYGDKYTEPNIYNSYSDLITTIKSDLIAHNLFASYTPITEDIKSDHSKFFLTETN